MSEPLSIEARDLARSISAGECIVFDCRFDLQHSDSGRNSWLAAHIPGAVHAHVDEELAGHVTARSGRHPLPLARSFAAFLARSGWHDGLLTVAYDAHGGAFAARLWWLMRYFGLDNAVLLNGGISAWMSAKLPLEQGEVRPVRQATPALVPRREMVVTTGDVAAGLADSSLTLVDARDRHRFEGQEEPIDPVAGHVPGALNHPYSLNLAAGRRFKSPGELAAGFRSISAGAGPNGIVHMCGSGVTACLNIFAMELAGFEGTRLYAGSWSEWIRDPARPVALGPA
jgi:thiosulfate/3-mercaptopyruvate sulfurtransferase